MTLRRLEDLYRAQVRQIARPLPSDYWPSADFVERIRFLFAEERKHRRRVDQAVRQFCESKQWPTLPTPGLVFLVGMRLMSAAGLTRVLRIGTPPLKWCETDARAQHQWLLLQTWRWRSDEWLRLEAISSLTGTLYAEPAPTPKQN